MTTAMFDLQVNGYAGTDFNADSLTAESLHHACECLEEDGVFGVLAAVITDDLAMMCKRLERLIALREKDELAQKIIAGVHIEGPFISGEKGYVGAHPARHARRANVEDAMRLMGAAGDLALLITLAPECDPGYKTISWLAAQGVCVSAGHCNPSLDQLRGACDHGLKMFTHLGNGCPMELPRHDNIIQRALSLHEQLWLCFIPDGVHVEPYALRNYVRMAGVERSIFVTDAISASRLGPGRYHLAEWEIDIGADMIARSPDGSHFVGSTVTWPRIQEVNRQHLGFSEEELYQLAFKNPLSALGVAM